MDCRPFTLLLLFFLASLALPEVAEAQAPRHTIAVCMDTGPRSSGFLAEPEAGESSPLPDPRSIGGADSADEPVDVVRWLLMDLHECALDYAQTDIVPLVQPWFNAFLVILVVWTGLTIAFGGTFDMSKVIAIVLTIGFANMLFYYYYLPMPFLGLDRGIPYAIAQGAEVISEEFFTQADGIYYDAFDEA